MKENLFTKLELRNKLVEDEGKFPLSYLMISFGYLIGQVVLNLVKGLFVHCGTLDYWIVIFITFMYLMGCTIYGFWYVKRNMDRKKWCNYAKIEGDLNFSGNQLYVYHIYGELKWCGGL